MGGRNHVSAKNMRYRERDKLLGRETEIEFLHDSEVFRDFAPTRATLKGDERRENMRSIIAYENHCKYGDERGERRNCSVDD